MIVGNGAGKSTVLNAIAGVWPIDTGNIIIDGQDVTGLPEHKRAAFLGRLFPRLAANARFSSISIVAVVPFIGS